MSDNIDPCSGVRKEVAAVKHLPFHIIPRLIQGSEDCSEYSTVFNSEEVFDVLKE
jgi:hypothetical protein